MKDKNYLYNMFNATATDDGNGDIETYENWLERQLLSRIERLEQLILNGVINWTAISEKPVNYSTVIIDINTKDGRQWTMPANYRDNRFVECTTNNEFMNLEQSEIVGWTTLPKQSCL